VLGFAVALTPAADTLAGLSLLVGGAATWRQASGRLLVLTGAAWFAGDVVPALLYAHRGPLVHVLVTYPRGGLAGGVVVAAAYVDGLVPPLARSLSVTAALAAAVVALVAWRCLRASRVERRARAASLPAALLVCATLVAAPAWAYDLAVAIAAVGLAADLRWGRWTQAAITGLVVDLGDEPRALQATLARMLGDPGLRLAYRVDGWVDEAGHPVSLPPEGVTYVESDGGHVAALVHDRAVLSDPLLADSVSTAVGLVVANVRMQGEVAARGREVAASRRRLLEAADEERRRLGEDLRVGVDRQLEAIGTRIVALGANPAALRLAEELDAARGELRALAQGIHPKALTEHGLRAALEELAARATLPVSLDVESGRFQESHEAAAFFVCSEALTNVAKYAHASRAEIAVSRAHTRLLVRVVDDGVGGADPARGSGLRGLADRLDALGGALRVDSPPRAGTRLEAELPLGGTP
jgi:signal transduction histidine kinase